MQGDKGPLMVTRESLQRLLSDRARLGSIRILAFLLFELTRGLSV